MDGHKPKGPDDDDAIKIIIDDHNSSSGSQQSGDDNNCLSSAINPRIDDGNNCDINLTICDDVKEETRNDGKNNHYDHQLDHNHGTNGSNISQVKKDNGQEEPEVRETNDATQDDSNHPEDIKSSDGIEYHLKKCFNQSSQSDDNNLNESHATTTTPTTINIIIESDDAKSCSNNDLTQVTPVINDNNINPVLKSNCINCIDSNLRHSFHRLLLNDETRNRIRFNSGHYNHTTTLPILESNSGHIRSISVPTLTTLTFTDDSDAGSSGLDNNLLESEDDEHSFSCHHPFDHQHQNIQCTHHHHHLKKSCSSHNKTPKPDGSYYDEDDVTDNNNLEKHHEHHSHHLHQHHFKLTHRNDGDHRKTSKTSSIHSKMTSSTFGSITGRAAAGRRAHSLGSPFYTEALVGRRRKQLGHKCPRQPPTTLQRTLSISRTDVELNTGGRNRLTSYQKSLLFCISLVSFTSFLCMSIM